MSPHPDSLDGLAYLEDAVAWTRRSLGKADGDVRLTAAGVEVMYLRRRYPSYHEVAQVAANALVALAILRGEEGEGPW